MAQYWLEVTKGEKKGKRFPIEDGTNLIGRWDPDAGAFPEVDLEEEDVDAKISRKHAVVVKRGEIITVEDLGSLNGTFVNRGQRLDKGIEHTLNAGDELVIGKVFLKLGVE